MAGEEIDVRPVVHVTVDAIGKPGERVFYLQGRDDIRVITLLIEKMQVQSMALGVEEFIAEVATKYPDLSDASPFYNEEDMHITPPVDPLFRVEEMGLAYDTDSDLIVFVAREFIPTEDEEAKKEEQRVVRFWCTRSQARALAHWGLEIASRGRPICPQCSQPMEPSGHFCPKKNGHKR